MKTKEEIMKLPLDEQMREVAKMIQVVGIAENAKRGMFPYM